MNNDSLWWLTASIFLLIAGSAGALESCGLKLWHRRLGSYLAAACLLFSALNLIGSFTLPADVRWWGFAITVLHTLLMFLFCLSGWFIGLSQRDTRH